MQRFAHTIVNDDCRRPFALGEGLVAAVDLRRDMLFEPGFLDWVEGRGRQALPGLAPADGVVDCRRRHVGRGLRSSNTSRIGA
jgi:hypothetical protein